MMGVGGGAASGARGGGEGISGREFRELENTVRQTKKELNKVEKMLAQ